jgi:hypothetical protein
MINPFHPFTKQLLDAFIARNQKYFVRQTLPRAENPLEIEEIKGYFLISQYQTLGQAQEHYAALEKDKNRFLYEWNNPEHQERLIKAATTPEGYRIFASIFTADAQERIKRRLDTQFKSYVKWKLNWYPKRADGLEMSFYVQYGEVYCQLKTGSREARVKLEEIEKFK